MCPAGKTLSGTEEFGCGVVMGVVQCVVGHPFDTLKVVPHLHVQT